MFWLGLLLTLCYVPGYTGASVPTQWAMLAIILPFGLWRGGPTFGHKLLLAFVAYATLLELNSLNLYSWVWGMFLIFIWALSFHWGTVFTDLHRLWHGLAVGLCVNVAVALAQALDYPLVEMADINRPAGLFFNSSLFGVILGLVMVGLVCNRLWWYLPPLTFGLILSGSRGGIAVFAIGLAAHYGRTIAALTVAVGGALYFAFTYDPADAQRLQIWGVTLNALSAFGHGPGSFIDLHFVRETKLLLIRPEFVHNDPLQLIYEFGIAAILPASLFGLALTNASHRDWPVAVAFCALACFFFPLYTPLTAFLGFLLAGSMLSTRAVVRRERHVWRPDFLSRLAEERSVPDLDRREAVPMVSRTSP